MNLHPLRALLLLPLFALLVLAARPAAAQPALPAPSFGEAPRGSLAPLYPTQGEAMPLFVSFMSGHPIVHYLMWSPASPESVYKVQFKLPGAGKISVPVIPDCSPDLCMLETLSFAHKLVQHTHSGMVIKWRIVATDGPSKMTGAWETAEIHESWAALPQAPVNGALASPEVFMWAQISPDQNYTLFVKDMTSGKTIVKRTYVAGPICEQGAQFIECSVSLDQLGVTLKPGRVYKWWVKSVGPSGEKTTSEKLTFTTPILVIGL